MDIKNIDIKSKMRFGINTLSKGLNKGISNEMTSFDMASIKTYLNPINRIKRGIEDGFNHFELSYDINFLLPGIFNKEIIMEMLTLKEKHEITFSVHLPFKAIDFSYPHPDVNEAYAKLMSDVIKNVTSLEVEAFVLHATGKLAEKAMETPAGESVVKHLLEFSSKAIVRILNDTKIESNKIAVENMAIPFNLMDDMIDDLGLSICMDAGHILSGVSGDYTLKSFLDEYYDKIAEIHFHDGYNRFELGEHASKAHIALGKGDMDPVWFINELKRRGYDKSIVFEMSSYKDILESYNKLREM